MLAVERTPVGDEPIPCNEVWFHPHSFADADGRLFEWNGELYRGIKPGRARFFFELLNSGLIERLTAAGLLIATDVTPLSLDQYELIVRHKRIPFVSYPNEWPAPMLNEAALNILDLAIELSKNGLTLKDAHPWNVVFDGLHPVYVDLTSIAPASEGADWLAFDEFRRFCLYPLFLMARGHDRIARSLLPEYAGVLRSDVVALTPPSALLSPFVLRHLFRRSAKPFKPFLGKASAASRTRFLERLRKDVASIKLSSVTARRIKEDPRPKLSMDSTESSCSNLNQLHAILSRLRPESVLTLGGGLASLARMAASVASRIVCFDSDAGRAAGLYLEARQNNLPIHSLVIDFVKPTPAVGYSSHYSIAATERLKCDVVLAPALIEQLVFEKYLTFDLISEARCSFSKRWGIVGFTPRERLGHSERSSAHSTGYALPNFIDALKRRFQSVEVLPNESCESALIVCEKHDHV